ncbi:MAG: class I SAM-dependent methyltransferase [Aeromicrobium sp.]
MSEESDSLPRLLTDLNGWYALTMLGVGLRTGLLEALLAGPGDAADLARRADVEERNALEWLRAVTAAGYATYESGTFSATAETVGTFGPEFPADARGIIDWTWEVPDCFTEVIEAMRTGSGVDPAAYANVGAAAGRINAPTYAAVLISEWIGQVPGLAERLSAGAAVAEIAPGNGAAATLVARAFPRSRVVGYDVGAPEPSPDRPDNFELRVADARDLPDDGPFDFVYCLDALHHLGDPTRSLAQMRKILAPDGVLMLAETDLTGDLAQDVQHPFATITYSSGVLYCLQESLAAGGGPHSGGDGRPWIEEALAEVGFDDVSVTASPTGFAIFVATAGR